jgi:hypothetical protein
MKFSMKNVLMLVVGVGLIVSNQLNAQTINFPDPNFKNAILENGVDLDKDQEIQLHEAQAVTVLNVSSKEITDLTGIEAFKNLKELSCNWNELTLIDVSKNDSLEGLFCASNRLTKIDLSKNLLLSALAVDENPLTVVDLTNNEKLSKLTCTKTSLTVLDLTKNLKLIQLNCTSNPDLKTLFVPVINAAVNNKRFKKDNNTQWMEKSKAPQGQGGRR